MGAGNTLPRRLPRHPKIVGQVPPRTARPEPPRDRLKDLAVITPPTATLALGGRQNRLHHNPKLIRDHTSTSHCLIITDQTAHIWETRPSPNARDLSPAEPLTQPVGCYSVATTGLLHSGGCDGVPCRDRRPLAVALQ